MCRDNKTNSKKDFCDYPVTGWSTIMGLNQMILLVLRRPLSKGKEMINSISWRKWDVGSSLAAETPASRPTTAEPLPKRLQLTSPMEIPLLP